jgi:hypothetical protein
MPRTKARTEFDRLNAKWEAELVSLYGSGARHASYDDARNGSTWSADLAALCILYSLRNSALANLPRPINGRAFQRREVARMKAQR